MVLTYTLLHVSACCMLKVKTRCEQGELSGLTTDGVFICPVWTLFFVDGTTKLHITVAQSGPVSTEVGDRSIPGEGHLSWYVTSHPGQLSLAIPSWVGAMSTSQKAVMLCGWGVKAGMVHLCVAGKTVWSPCYTWAISEHFRDKELVYNALYKFAFFTFTLLLIK